MAGVVALLVVLFIIVPAVAVYLDPHNDPEFMRHHDAERCAYCNGHVYPFV